ncbi:hypothetical protein [Nocardia arthritidis]|uniref:PE domain-containing protein n=1 Tax=Nocardia arthritidis TaxID=228602 RepID=A0A6G9Y6I3_9NOCA|nr:hypothetical protein [Nocardia arthritidis]QIS08812.1 hypothetical protein F5544_04490 [Nocardia arthritidis]
MSTGQDPAGWRRVLELAKSGEIKLDPAIGKGLDKVCDDYLEKLGTVLTQIKFLADVSGFGPLPSGQALQEKFKVKASGTDASLEAVIKQHIEAVQLAKEAVTQAIANITGVDQATADKFSGIEAPK